jgi:hypothetical protein
VYIPSSALNGSRRHRLGVGAVLFVFMLIAGVALTVTAFQSIGGDVLVVVGFAAGAVSAYLLAWWCARYWYVAFCQGAAY